MIGHNLEYNCSDNITNEVFRKENEKTKKSIFYISINLGIELFVVSLNIIYIINCFSNKQKIIMKEIMKMILILIIIIFLRIIFKEEKLITLL